MPSFCLQASTHRLLWLGLCAITGVTAATATAPAPAYTLSTATQSSHPTGLPGRAGRLADFSGAVWIYEHDLGQWVEAVRNRPITTGDRISTGNEARAEVRVGSTALRIGARSELEVMQLDDHRLSLQLHTGAVALRLRTRDWAEQLDISTPEVRLKPLQAGHYRIDRQDDVSGAGAWRGELLVDEASAFPIAGGQRMEFWRERGVRQQRWANLPQDSLHAWAVAEDQREERTAFNRYVSPEMTGAEELDRHGRWDRVPEYGVVWFPWQVSVGWAPYLFGRWVWVRHWGWTWVDNQPWGFAPFHYGRWVQWRGQWGWVPGTYTPRPVFTPAPRPPHAGKPVPPPYGLQPHPHEPRPGRPGLPGHPTFPGHPSHAGQPAAPGVPMVPATPMHPNPPPHAGPRPGWAPTPQPVIVPPTAGSPGAVPPPPGMRIPGRGEGKREGEPRPAEREKPHKPEAAKDDAAEAPRKRSPEARQPDRGLAR